MKKILQNWREIIGWLIIVFFAHYSIYRMDVYDRKNYFYIYTIIVVMVLIWLKINKNNANK